MEFAKVRSKPKLPFLEPLSEGDTSRAIACARVILISSLVFVHYIDYPFGTMLENADKLLASYPVATFVQRTLDFLNNGLIILLSAISGWLFFRLPSANHWPKLRKKVYGRIRSFLTPLLFWCGFYFVVLLGVSRLDPASPLLNGFNFDYVHPGWRDYGDALLGITAYPIDYPFWFMRDLFVSVMVSPLLWLALKRAPYTWAVIFGLIWLCNVNFRIFYKPDVMCFFYFGGLLQLKKIPLGVSTRTTIICAALVLAIAALRAVAPALIPWVHFERAPLSIFLRGFRLVGLLAAWGAAIRIARIPVSTFIANLGGLSIFFFGAHALVLAAIKLILQQFLPGDTDGWQLAQYILAVSLTLTFTYAAGALVARLSPSLFDFVTGGRADQNQTIRASVPTTAPPPAPEGISVSRNDMANGQAQG